METPDRDQREYELAAAILILWMLCESVPLNSGAAWKIFYEGFNEHVRPILTRIYGVARATLAQQFGHEYQTSTNPATGATVIQIPRLTQQIDQYARDLYETFQRRQVDFQQRREEAKRQAEADPEAEPVVVPEFNEGDAERIAVTTTTEVQSKGEMDGAKDVETRVGDRLVAVWRTEAGSCPRCSPLDGTIDEWRRLYPQGPPIHPNCVLSDAKVSFPFGNTAAMRADYKGQAVEILTRSGSIIRVTAGHLIPVAPDSSKLASAIQVGDQLHKLAAIGYQEDAEGLFNASTENEEFLHVRAIVKPHYFHNEGISMRGQVNMSLLDPRQKFVNLENTLARKPLNMVRFIRHIPTDTVTSVRSFEYEGPVYDFSGDSLAFFAVDGVIVHNCRCHLDWRLFLE